MGWREWERNATGQILSSGVETNKILAMVKSEGSISMVMGKSGAQWRSTRAELNASFSQ